MKIAVLRLGHRPQRDKRLTTHVCLVARAFGAKKVFLTTRDIKIKESIEKVVKKFGDSFKVEFCENWEKFIKKWQGVKVHLTMYGENINTLINKIPRNRDLLVVVGAEKVPGKLYELADYNLAVSNQPHSEVAALAVFLDRYFKGKQFKLKFKRAKLKIVPSERGKRVRVQKQSSYYL